MLSDKAYLGTRGRKRWGQRGSISEGVVRRSLNTRTYTCCMPRTPRQGRGARSPPHQTPSKPMEAGGGRWRPPHPSNAAHQVFDVRLNEDPAGQASALCRRGSEPGPGVGGFDGCLRNKRMTTSTGRVPCAENRYSSPRPPPLSLLSGPSVWRDHSASVASVAARHALQSAALVPAKPPTRPRYRMEPAGPGSVRGSSKEWQQQLWLGELSKGRLAALLGSYPKQAGKGPALRR